MYENPGFPLDDSWIHQSIAQNLGEHFELSFNKGELTTGSTSLLWTFILSLNFAFFKIDPVYYTLTLSILLYFLTGIFLYKLLEKQIDELTSVIIVILFSITGTVVFFVFSGMEISLFYFLSITSIYFFEDKRFLLSGFLCGLLALTRPEGLGLFVILAIAELYNSLPKIEKRKLLFLIIPPIVFFGISTFINFYICGSLLPTTFKGRKWFYGLKDKSFYLDFEHTWSFLSSWYLRIKMYTFGIKKSESLIRDLSKNCINYLLFLSVLIGSLGILKDGLLTSKDKKGKGIFLLFIWSIALNFSYIIFLPASGHAGRYQSINYLFIALTLVLGIKYTVEKLFKRLRFVTKITWLAWIILLAIFFNNFLFWSEITKINIFHINNTNKKMGLYLKSHLPENEKVAVFDVGAIKFFSNQHIVDLGGITDVKFIPYLYSRNPIPYLKNNGVRYVVLPYGFDNRTMMGWSVGLLKEDNKIRLTKIKEFSTPEHIWEFGKDAIYNADPKQVLLKIVYR